MKQIYQEAKEYIWEFNDNALGGPDKYVMCS